MGPPDVYDGVPTVVTTWLAVMPKISILLFLLESSFKGIIQFTDIANTVSNLSIDGDEIQLWVEFISDQCYTIIFNWNIIRVSPSTK